MFMPATQNHLQHSDTGVFGSSNNRNKQQAVHREVQCQAQSTDHHLGPNSSFQSNCTATAPAGAQVPSCAAHSQVFQYPEDPTSPPDSHRFTALHERTSVTAARHDAQQHLHTHPPDWNRNLQTHQHGQQKASNQVAQYTVQEPDSPCHTSSLHNPSRNLQPAAAVMHTGSSARRTGSNSVDGSDLPAGCLYQDTTIRRTTTPVKNGKRSTAWAHEEFVTVRQIREIKRSEAHNMSWLQRGEPHTTQGALSCSPSLQECPMPKPCLIPFYPVVILCVYLSF